MAKANRKQPTLHAEIVEILGANDNVWMTTQQLADQVNERSRYKKKDGSAISAYQIHGRTKQYPNLFERDRSQARLLGAVRPLPYSAFPEKLAAPIGRMAVAFACIEGRVFDLIDELSIGAQKDQALAKQLDGIKKIVSSPTFDAAERNRIQVLVDHVRRVSRYRNALLHSPSHGFDKRNGDTMLYSPKRNQGVWVNADTFDNLARWMYQILDAFDQRHYSVSEWHEDLAPYEPYGLPDLSA